MSIYILKTSHITIKIGNSNVRYKLQFYTSHNTFKITQLAHNRAKISPCLPESFYDTR